MSRFVGILTLKEKRGVLNFDPSARTAEKAEEAVGSSLNRDLERKIAAAAVTVVKNEDNTFHLRCKQGTMSYYSELLKMKSQD